MVRRMVTPLVLAAVLAVAAQPAQAQKRPNRPVLNQCSALAPLQEGQIGRTAPMAVPKTLKKIARADRDRLAVVTLDRVTICVDMRTKGKIGNLALSPDSRFLSFDWKGYEAEGHVLIDRSGTGKELNTGVAPVFSASRRRFAAVHQSASAFSELQGLAIWEVDPVGVRQIATVSSIPEMLDWRVEGWGGEHCINLSAVPFSRLPDDNDLSKVNRDRYTARPVGTTGATWRVTRYIGRGC